MGVCAGPRNINIFDLLKYKFPIMAIASILHRISGFILFLFIPFMIYLLQKSLHSAAGFSDIFSAMTCPIARFFIWVLLSALWYHLLAGVKHLLMDMGFLESKLGGKISASIVIILALIGIVLLGVWLW